MPKFSLLVLVNCAILLPLAANAAGTYYTGAAYRPVQSGYGQSGTYATSGYGRASATTNSMPSMRYNAGYNNYSNYNNYSQSGGRVNQTQTQKTSSQKSSKNGFFVNGGITHENAMWKFEMNKIANSILNYNNLAWNVLDLNGGYVFDLGKTKMQVDAGFKYGMQWGESNMTDDDISNGGFEPVDLIDDANNVIGQMVGHALSVGTSNDGNMLGFNVGFGLTDFFQIGNLKITPSIGYRYLKYKLETKNNYGLAVTSAACFSLADGEVQCDPAIAGFYKDSKDKWQSYILWRDSLDEDLQISTGTVYVDTGNTYYYTQSGVSHSYETEWSGPYLALDMLYDINQNNSVNGRVEVGFPGYKSTGDQPYRWDWAHPKSVEDSAGMFSAFHFGFLANWKTAITNSVWLSLGVTYDYYNVSGASASTYLNQGLYNQLIAKNNNDEQALLTNNLNTDLYNYLLDKYNYSSITDADKKAEIEKTVKNGFLSDSLTAQHLNDARNDCGGWVCKSSNEVDSIYKSMGIRVGFEAKF